MHRMSVLGNGSFLKYLPLFFVALVAAVARMTRWGKDLWIDEAFNWHVSKDTVADAVQRISFDFFPPLYSILLSGWLDLVEASPLMLRLPSMAAGVFAVIFVYLLVERAVGRKAAIVAALLVALSPRQAYWAQVARPFAIETMFIVAAVYYAHGVALLRSTAGRALTHGLVKMAICMVAAIYTSHGAVFFVFAVCCVLLADHWREEKKLLDAYGFKVAAAFLFILIAWLPLLPGIFDQMALSQELVIAAHRPSLGGVLSELGTIIGFSHLWTLRPVGLVLIGLMYVWGMRALFRSDKSSAMFFLGLTMGFVVALLALFTVADPLFGRVLVRSNWLGVLVLLVAGIGSISALETIRNILGSRSSVALVSVLALFLLSLHMRALYAQTQMERASWSKLADVMEPHVRASDSVVGLPWIAYGSISYYLPEVFGPAAVNQDRRAVGEADEELATLFAGLRREYRDKSDRFWIIAGESYARSVQRHLGSQVVTQVEVSEGQLHALLVLTRPSGTAPASK